MSAGDKHPMEANDIDPEQLRSKVVKLEKDVKMLREKDQVSQKFIKRLEGQLTELEQSNRLLRTQAASQMNNGQRERASSCYHQQSHPVPQLTLQPSINTAEIVVLKHRLNLLEQRVWFPPNLPTMYGQYPFMQPGPWCPPSWIQPSHNVNNAHMNHPQPTNGSSECNTHEGNIVQGKTPRHSFHHASDVNTAHSQPVNTSPACTGNIHGSKVVQDKPLHPFHRTSDKNATFLESTSTSLNTHMNKSMRGSPSKSFNHANDSATCHVKTAPVTVNSYTPCEPPRIPS